jgi:FKBP-type peptidyl-prolyl cis-trans isomerase
MIMTKAFQRLSTLKAVPVLVSIALLVFVQGFTGCESGDPLEKEKAAIEAYKVANGITTQPLASGLYYIATKTGTGVSPKYGSQVKVKYKGTYTDGTEFDSGTFSFFLGYGQVISGWDEGISYMKEGGKAILIIPSSLAYGTDGYGDIPGYSPLVFEVELIDVY